MNDRQTYSAGGYDWLARWREIYDAERAQAEAATDPAFERHSDDWAPRAARFAAMSRSTSQPDGFMQWLLPRLHPSDTVLDIGAGAGRYVPLLARRVAQVIALEPSPAMREQLAQRVADEGLANVTIVATAWPPEQPIQADVVMAAHVLYAVRDVGPFLHAMNAAAQRACYLYLGLRHPAAVLGSFWQRLRGEPRLPLPAALEALNVLYQLGFYAKLELVPITNRIRFNDAAEALDDIRQRLRYAPDSQRDAAIAAAIAELLVPNDDGSLSPPHQDRDAAVLWWEP